MTTIKAIAHLDELTKDVNNDYYLRPGSLGTLYEDDIIQRLEKKEIATKNVNGKVFIQLFLREYAQAVSEGYNVVTGLFHATIGINGTVYSKDLGRNVPAGQVNARIALTQGGYAREAIGRRSSAFTSHPSTVRQTWCVFPPTNWRPTRRRSSSSCFRRLSYPSAWRVKVATQSSESVRVLTKEIREYEYPDTVMVV
jgi:hypothetical protein